MQKSYRFLIFGIAAFCMCFTAAVPTYAYQNMDFMGRGGGFWKTVSTGMRKDTHGSGTVNWRLTDRPAHAQFFRILDRNGSVMGTRRIPSVNDGSYAVMNTYRKTPGNHFSLQTRRENWFDPNTWVSGIWSAD